MLSEPRSRGRTYTLCMLTLIYAISVMDRKIITILQEPIKREFALSDWQLGLMSGFAFVSLYVVLGIPVARAADRGVNRVSIIAYSLIIWSAATAACGFVQNYAQLVASRIAVGIGEAGFGPPAQSLIADHYVPTERGRAMGIFALAAPAGIILGLGLGGAVSQAFGWRVALLLVGLPGVLLALILKLTVKDPRNSEAAEAPAARPTASSLREAAKVMAAKRSYVLLLCGASTGAFANLGLQSWYPSFFVRSFGMSLGAVGVTWGIAAGVAGLLGAYGGGWLADRFGARDPKFVLLVPAVAMLLSIPFQIVAVLAGSWLLALLFLLVPTALNAMYIAPTMSLNQSLAPTSLRATSAAFSTLVVNLVGLGLGPVLLGLVSDIFASIAGDTGEGLRLALIAISPLYLLTAACFALASRSLARDLDMTE